VTERILVDTGPLVAILSSNDPYHETCMNQLRSLSRTQPLLTCWPVLTEAAWLLRKAPGAASNMLRAVDGQRVKVMSLGQDAAVWIAGFLENYASLPAQLADAALMYLAERERIDTVFTLDRRHFSVYRVHGNKALQLLPEA
jgi:predicted nucleic acid-binding protein